MMMFTFEHGPEREPTLDGRPVTRHSAHVLLRTIRGTPEGETRLRWNLRGDGGECDVTKAEAATLEFETPTSAEDVKKTSEVEMMRCDCGHTVPRTLAVYASLGTSCPDCYDRMS